MDGGDGGKATRAPRDGALPRGTHAQLSRPPRPATRARCYPQSAIPARLARLRFPSGVPHGGDEEAVEMMCVRVGGGAMVPRPRCSIAVVAEARVWGGGRSVVGRSGIRALLAHCKRDAASDATRRVALRSGWRTGNSWAASPRDCSAFSALRGRGAPRGAQRFSHDVCATTGIPQISDATLLFCVPAWFGANVCGSLCGTCRAAKERCGPAHGLSVGPVARRSER